MERPGDMPLVHLFLYESFKSLVGYGGIIVAVGWLVERDLTMLRGNSSGEEVKKPHASESSSNRSTMYDRKLNHRGFQG